VIEVRKKRRFGASQVRVSLAPSVDRATAAAG
jgi:hypothetical protein